MSPKGVAFPDSLYGAGVFNAGSHLGCAQLYHHAASELLSLCPDAASANGERDHGAWLAISWLRRIVTDNPLVDDRNCGRVAWELRFAFDSSRHTELFDQVTMMVPGVLSASVRPSSASLVALISKVLNWAASLIAQDEVAAAAYLQRHLAEVVLSALRKQFGEEPPSESVYGLAMKLLARPVNECRRIGLDNVNDVCEKLNRIFVTLQSWSD